MRRADRERSDAAVRRGFQVLDPGGSGRYLEPLTPPPPPRAPEPYKVAAPSSSLGRAHRRSSFVIIAETRPSTPISRSPSPGGGGVGGGGGLATGRVSPFRGRGFKGPLPHAQSRPQSPENRQPSGRRRFDRRTSVSQQSSPKRSLIPQPTRRRSVSLTKANERKPSPKFGRRAPVVRKNSNPRNGTLNGGGSVSRRQSLKAPDLSPIQGTPTKPVDASGRVRGGNSLSTKTSPTKTRNTLTVPRNVGNARRTIGKNSSNPIKSPTKRFVEEKRPNGDSGSPTKIPVRRGSINGKNGSTLSLSTSRNPGKTGKPPRPGEVAANIKNDPKSNSLSKSTENPGSQPSGNREDRKDEKKGGGDPPGSRFIEINNSPTESKKRDEDPGLMDLLRQTSGATGTSSVVNTTTTTAVQPLQIEAAAILLETDRATSSEATASSKNSTALPSPASRDVSPASGVASSEAPSLPKTPRATNARRETGAATSSDVGKPESREAEVAATAGTSSNASHKNPGKNPGNATEEPSGNPAASKKDATSTATNSRDKTSKEGNPGGSTVGGGVAKKSHLTRNGIQEGSRSDMRVPSANPGSRVNNSNSNSNSNTNSNSNAGNNNVGGGGGGSERNGSGKESSGETSGKSSGGKVVDAGSSLASGHRKSDSRGSATSNGNGSDAPRIQTRNVGGGATTNAGGRIAESTANPATTGNVENGKFRGGNHGSETSLRSSNGPSTGSVDSVGSTDTGVSVNTVRGVSSAREKKGTHTVKRPDEIETLSGNLMHLERNGEPAVLDITEAPEEPAGRPEDNTRLGRLKNSLTGLRDRLPSMRCLGCRRNRKGQPWPGEQPGQGMEQLPANGAGVAAGNGRFRRVWTNLKNSCRCTRLRECKCCRRAARVAPSESGTACCPPERRCGALCRRLFARCRCCGASEDERMRSIRAKHSLTSVGPPPLSEEQRAKIPEVLVEHNSVMRGAIPCLPVPLAWFCLVWNVLIPGSGTVWSGLFNLCVGQPRFSITASPRARFGALVVNTMVGVGQLFTVLFCLVGWGWSIWWGVTMIRLARKYKRFRASEAANGDAEARGGDSTALPPGVPSQALRGMERAR